MLDQLTLDHRMTVGELPTAIALGSVVVDIRSQRQRTREGPLYGALAIGSDVVVNRLDPASPSCLALAREHTGGWILVCSSGDCADVIAAGLRGRGLGKVMSLVGGFRALCAASSLTIAARTPHFERSVAMVLCG
ncbi:rhodanese-like domain-containing protein [Nocardia iowensis]|uniref:Sulfurtransferase n=1 Tax=Nocardia iowensis TaxID=204891 RepID=A0ABX8RN11_NOCIO|nr:sulfurtransferase [Nocardia iowensis]QXN90696.1 sulfurtransferase [Nocardia iowensis]